MGHPPAESHKQSMNASQLKIKLHLDKVTQAIKMRKNMMGSGSALEAGMKLKIQPCQNYL